MKSRTTRLLSFTTLIGMVVIIVAFLAITASTHAAVPTRFGPAVKTGQTNISQTTGQVAHYNPITLLCNLVNGSCSITIKNTTLVTQSVTSGGTTLYILAPRQSQVVSYSSAGTYTYSLASNAKATLTVTVSGKGAMQANIFQAIGGAAHYNPKTLFCTLVSGTCSIIIKNTTSVTQSVTSGGTTLYTLAPKQSQVVSYTATGTYTYSLASNTTATLTVTVS